MLPLVVSSASAQHAIMDSSLYPLHVYMALLTVVTDPASHVKSHIKCIFFIKASSSLVFPTRSDW